MPKHARLLVLGAAALAASCAAAPRPSMKEVSEVLSETVSEWHAFHMEEWKSVDPEKQDAYLEKLSPVHTALTATELILTVKSAVPEDRWFGSVRIDGELRAGKPVTIRLTCCPPGRRFILYSSTDLAEPRPRTREGEDYWVLDRDRQAVEGEGSVDSRGEASVQLVLPEDPALAGSFRAYQARLLDDAGDPSGPAFGFTTAHGRRLK